MQCIVLDNNTQMYKGPIIQPIFFFLQLINTAKQTKNQQFPQCHFLSQIILFASDSKRSCVASQQAVVGAGGEGDYMGGTAHFRAGDALAPHLIWLLRLPLSFFPLFLLHQPSQH